MSSCPTIRIKSDVDWTPFFVINAEDFDQERHEKYDEESDELRGAMKVAELRAALEARGIAIPEGAKKADLRALWEQVNGQS